MFEGIINFFKKFSKNEEESKSKDTAKERLHLVLMQDRANVSADFLDMMKQEIIDVIKKYIEVDEKEIDVKLTNKTNEDGSIGAPALYANIPISKIKNELPISPLQKISISGWISYSFIIKDNLSNWILSKLFLNKFTVFILFINLLFLLYSIFSNCVVLFRLSSSISSSFIIERRLLFFGFDNSDIFLKYILLLSELLFPFLV